MSEIVALHSTNTEDEEEDNFFSRLFSRFSSKEKQADPADDVQKKKKSRYATGSLTQFRWLIWRNFVDTFKNPFEIRLRIGLALVSYQSNLFLRSFHFRSSFSVF